MMLCDQDDVWLADKTRLQLDYYDRRVLDQVCHLPDSTIWQRLGGFVRGTLRKNSFLRNAGLLLVLLFWLGKKTAHDSAGDHG